MRHWSVLNGSLETPEDPVSVVALLGGSLSLVGLAFAFITYSLFSDARDFGGVTLMNLLASLFLGQLLQIIVLGDPTLLQDSSSCLTLTVTQHYAWLAQFFWLLAVVRNVQRHLSSSTATSQLASAPVQRTRLSFVSGSFCHQSIIYWGIPAVIAAVIVIVEVSSQHRNLSCMFPMNSRVGLGMTVACGIFATGSIVVTALNTWALARGAKQLLLSMDQFQHIELRLCFAVKLLAVLLSVLTVAVVASLVQNTLWSPVFRVAFSLQGLLAALLLTCNCDLIKSFTQAAFARKRKQKKNYGTSSELVSSNLNLLNWNDDPNPV